MTGVDGIMNWRRHIVDEVNHEGHYCAVEKRS